MIEIGKLSPSCMQHRVHRELYSYWSQQTGGKCAPRKSDIDPVDIHHLLRQIGLIDVEGSHRFRYRLIGTAMVDYFGVDFTGSVLDECKACPYMEYLRELYDFVSNSALPTLSIGKFEFSNRAPRENVNRLLLPLVDDEGKIGVLLFSTYFSFDSATSWNGSRASLISDFYEDERYVIVEN